MSIIFIERDYEYWLSLFEIIEIEIKKISNEFERGVKWKYDVPLIKLNKKTSDKFSGPSLTRIGKGCKLNISLGFFKWMDDIVIDMLEHLGKDNGFCVSNGTNDISKWVLANWISYISAHECGHLFCGHYVGKSKEWDDWTIEKDFYSLDNKTRLAFEYDADMYAANSFFYAQAYAINTDKRLQHWGEKYFMDLGFIFFVLFTIMEEKDNGKSSHPPAADRLSIFMLRGFKCLELENKKRPDKEFKAFLLGLQQAIECIGEQGSEMLHKIAKFDDDKLKNSVAILSKQDFHNRRMYRMSHDWLRDTPNMFFKAILN